MPDICHQKQVRIAYEKHGSVKLSSVGGDYGNTGPSSGRSQNYGLDSDDYDETVGHQVTVDNRVENCDDNINIYFVLAWSRNLVIII